MDEPAPETGREPASAPAPEPVTEPAEEARRDVAPEASTQPEAEPAARPRAESEAEPAVQPQAGSETRTEPTAEPRPPAAGQRVLPEKLVFRTPGSAYVAIVFGVLCASFVGVAAPWLTVVFLLPLAAFVYVARTRTEVDADRLVIRTVATRRVLPWSQVASLRVADRGWVRAVRTDGGEIALPTVRTRHLPAIALITRGRISDPTEPAD